MQRPDIFFLSFDETLREKNWLILKSRFPEARRLHGLKGLKLAHQACASLSRTPFFFVVNADNEIHKDFYFQLPESNLEPKVYCWRALNPVNDLIYGFGGIKLFPKMAFQRGWGFSPSADMSTSLKVPYKIIDQLASITRFNSSPLEAFRAAFRECIKLSSLCIQNQKDLESLRRLRIWRQRGTHKPFGLYVLLGALHGENYGLKHKGNKRNLEKINDFDWISRYFSNIKKKPF